MSELLIKNATVVTLDTMLAHHSVLCDQGKITAIGPDQDLAAVSATQVIDAKGSTLAPGYLDLHIHGLHEHRLEDSPEALAAVCGLLPRYGTTGFLPTLCPRAKGKDAEFLNSLAQVPSPATQILGFHLEGPFLSLTGAIDPNSLGVADPDRVQALIAAAQPYQVIFSISPEFDGIGNLLPLMTRNHTAVFMTHTAANVQQTQAAIAAGVCHATHFYDVFPCPPQRDPGVRPCGAVEAVLADPRVSVDFILDGEHVDPIAAKMAIQCKGPDRVCLITDANVGAGLPPGRYSGFGEEVEFAYPGGPARMTKTSRFPGTLAGSGLTMDRAVRNAVNMLNIDLPLAVRLASANPAKVIGLGERKGQIKVGFDADLLLLDKQLNVTQTWVAAKCRFTK